MKSFFFILICALFLLVLVQPVAAWIDGYGNRGVQIIENGAYPDANYQFKYILHNISGNATSTDIYLSTDVKDDWSDIRFTDDDDNQYDYWIESTTVNSSTVWVEVPTIPAGDSSMYFYYGNATAISLSSGKNTFPFFDDFSEATINETLWWKSASNISIINGVCNVSGWGNYIVYNWTPANYFISDAALRARVIYPSVSGGGGWMGLTYSSSAQDGSSFGYDGANSVGIYKTNLGSLTGVVSPLSSWNIIENSIQYLDQDFAKYRINSDTWTEKGPLGTSYIPEHFGAVFNPSDYKNISIDWVLVRHETYLGGPPLATWGNFSGTPVIVGFTGTPLTITTGDTVNFTDETTGGPTSFYWDVNGDDVTDYTSKNCNHTYTQAGYYNVSLTAQKLGINDTETKIDYINVIAKPMTNNFTSDYRSGPSPLIIQFYANTVNSTSWYWDFNGDGITESTEENPTYVYTIVGGYNVTLAAGNIDGFSNLTRYNWIYVIGSQNQSGYGYSYPPKEVRFHVQSPFGASLTGVEVNAIGVQTTSGSFDWLSQILGIKLDETPIHEINLNGTTDSNGDISFLMIPSVKYNMTFTKIGETIANMLITPKDEYYLIYSTYSGDFYETKYNYNEKVYFNITTTVVNSTSNTVNIDYVDLLRQTTNAKIYINQTLNIGNQTNIYYETFAPAANGNFTKNINLNNTLGESYIIRVVTTHTTFGLNTRDFAVSFADLPKTGGLPSNIILFFAILLMIFVGMFFGASSATQGALVVCFVGWLFFALGWLNDLGASAPAALTLATVISIVAIVAKSKNESG